MRPDDNPTADLNESREPLFKVPLVESSFRASSLGGVADLDLEQEGEHQPEVQMEKLTDQGRQHRYVLKGEVGRGGMGAVLKVFDTDLRRNLAMKVILEKGADGPGKVTEINPQQLARFLEEAQVTGQLDHPGVVPVHELGVDSEGIVYFTMRLVKGEELSHIFERVHASDSEWSLKRALGVLLKVCETTSYAHDKGVIHRDLKPSNVMVGEYGEVYVMDWGLAKVAGRSTVHDIRLRNRRGASFSSVKTDRKDEREEHTDSPLMTMDGTVIGTPYYMPPEQARGRVDEVDARSDVYAVGAMLYQLLVGDMPYHSKGDQPSPHTVLAMVIQGPPADIHLKAPQVCEQLRDICSKAMEREPAKRYPSLHELADELRAFIEGRIESKRASIFEVLRLSTSLVMLYVGILVVALGPAIMLTLTWESTSPSGRFWLSAIPLVVLALVGRGLWRRSEWKTAVPFLLGSAMVAPCFAYVLLHAVPGLGHITNEDGEQIEIHLDGSSSTAEMQSALDMKLLFVSLAAILVGAYLRRMTKSQAFIWYLGLAATSSFFFVALLNGLRDGEPHEQAGVFLLFAASMTALGFLLEWKNRPLEGQPLYVLGSLLLGGAWWFFARSGYPVLYLGEPPNGEQIELSLVVGGVIAFFIALTAQRAGTPQLTKYSTIPYLLAPSLVLISFSSLVAREIRLYELLLPLTCLVFVMLSVAVQRKNLLYSGAGYISVAVFQITFNHFTNEWWWPLTLLLVGGVLAAGALGARRLASRMIEA